MALTTAAASRKDRSMSDHELRRFQHRHYAAIAAILRRMQEDGLVPVPICNRVTQHFANEFERANEKFDRSRFILGTVSGDHLPEDFA